MAKKRRVLGRRIQTPTGPVIVPAEERASEEFRRVPNNKTVYVEIIAVRNERQHRLFWALMAMVAATGAYNDAEDAATAIKYHCGQVKYVLVHPDGTTAIVPESISYGNMPQTEFAEFFEKAIKVIITQWLPHMTDEGIRNELENAIR